MIQQAEPPHSPHHLEQAEAFLTEKLDVTHHVDDNIFGMRTYYTGQHQLRAIIFLDELRCHPLHSGEVTLIHSNGHSRKTTLRDFCP